MSHDEEAMSTSGPAVLLVSFLALAAVAFFAFVRAGDVRPPVADE